MEAMVFGRTGGGRKRKSRIAIKKRIKGGSKRRMRILHVNKNARDSGTNRCPRITGPRLSVFDPGWWSFEPFAYGSG
jgi:hypothetical protein